MKRNNTWQLAQDLFDAGNREKRNHGPRIWGEVREWKDQPTETQLVWHAVAKAAKKLLRLKSGKRVIRELVIVFVLLLVVAGCAGPGTVPHAKDAKGAKGDEVELMPPTGKSLAKNLSAGEAVKIGFRWSHAHPETVDFYKLYYGDASRKYTNYVTAFTTNLVFMADRAVPHYFTVTACASNGLESDWCNEVVYPQHLTPRSNAVLVVEYSSNGVVWIDFSKQTNAVPGVMGLWKLRIE